jgi:DNA-binding MarR family transcriptional regulator
VLDNERFANLIRALDQSIAEFDQDGRVHHGRKTRRARRITGFDWTSSAVAILEAMQDDSVVRMTDLAERVGVASPTVSKLIRSMEQKGFVERTPDGQDGRASIIRLTEEGRRVAAAMDLERLEALEQLLSGWTDDELERFVTMFARLRADLQQLP